MWKGAMRGGRSGAVGRQGRGRWVRANWEREWVGLPSRAEPKGVRR